MGVVVRATCVVGWALLDLVRCTKAPIVRAARRLEFTETLRVNRLARGLLCIDWNSLASLIACQEIGAAPIFLQLLLEALKLLVGEHRLPCFFRPHLVQLTSTVEPRDGTLRP